MNYIIFGGSGFVGEHLVKRLINREHVIVCDLVPTNIRHTNLQYIQMDIRIKEQFNKILINKDEEYVVINLAANQYHHRVPRKNRVAFFELTNTQGALNILEWMDANGLPSLIQYTTDMTYGKPQYLPVDTKHQQNPFGPYGMSKKKTEDICREYRKKGMNITIFRPRMINGPGRLGILKKLFTLIKYNLPVPMIGNGQNCYQMISVFDCVEATILAVQHQCPNKEYNLGSENAPTIKNLLKELVNSVASKSVVVPTPGKLVKICLAILGFCGLEIMYKEQYMIADENYILDISETMKDLGWTPQYNDKDMIVQAYSEWNKNE